MKRRMFLRGVAAAPAVVTAAVASKIPEASLVDPAGYGASFRVKTWKEGDVLTTADLNGNFSALARSLHDIRVRATAKAFNDAFRKDRQ